MLALHISNTGSYAPTHGKHSLKHFRADGSPKPGCPWPKQPPQDSSEPCLKGKSSGMQGSELAGSPGLAKGSKCNNHIIGEQSPLSPPLLQPPLDEILRCEQVQSRVSGSSHLRTAGHTGGILLPGATHTLS